jgi:hypothetical protein
MGHGVGERRQLVGDDEEVLAGMIGAEFRAESSEIVASDESQQLT